MDDPEMLPMLVKGLWETLYMVLGSTLFSYVLGLPLGIALVVTGKQGIHPMRVTNTILNIVVNILRSVPFLILAITVMPVTRAIVGTTIGSTATIVPLVISAAPFIARLVESSIQEVDSGEIEAAQSMGASSMTIIFKVMLAEAKPSLLVGCAIALTTILGYSAMAGFVAGGGLGDIAIRYGYNRGETDVMLVTVAILVIVVQVLQEIGMWIAKHWDRRSK